MRSGCFALVCAGRILHVSWTPIYITIGIGVWLCLYEAGIHATIAGVAIGLLAPTTPHVQRDLIDEDDLLDLSDAQSAHQTSELARESVSTVEWLQFALHPWSSYLIVPLFTLANAGIPISIDRLADAVASPLSWGIMLGLVVGKPLGIAITSWFVTRIGVAEAPTDRDPSRRVRRRSRRGYRFHGRFVHHRARRRRPDRAFKRDVGNSGCDHPGRGRLDSRPSIEPSAACSNPPARPGVLRVRWVDDLWGRVVRRSLILRHRGVSHHELGGDRGEESRRHERWAAVASATNMTATSGIR